MLILLNRTKERKAQPNIKKGDLVLIEDKIRIRASWPLEFVIKIFPGKENIVRVANIRSINGAYSRPREKSLYGSGMTIYLEISF